jgi:glycosyltransferase involved in cell wall biosynthesis
MLPPVSRPPAATTVLDVQHELYPRFFSRAELAYRRVVYGWTVRRSRIVVTISEHARQGLIERLGLDPARVRAIHLGIDHERFRPGPSDEPREDFLLYPALGWPHKNHRTLFAAFALLRARRPGLRLVLTGYEGTVPEGVEARGRVPADELVRLYRRAAALVFPSRYEGFGQPVLEAMACGCPVACSAIPALAEVAGGAARTFAPDDPEAIAEAVSDVLANAADYRQRGLERASSFTWERAAGRYEDVYGELL